MAQDRKNLLIVDDTKIDRMVLKSILNNDFEVLEASSGNMAFEYITTRRDQLDVILLDLSMPHIDGFDVLKFMKEKGIDDIPVFVVTAEPTRDNVEKALQYNVGEFIGKPFDKDDILWRLRSRLGIIPDYDLQKEDITETEKYISDLEVVYKTYLNNFEKSDEHCRNVSALMKIMLNAYSKSNKNVKLTPDNIKFISKAAYFCDIGNIFIPDKQMQIMTGHTRTQELQKKHTLYGSNLVKLNRSAKCRYFVEICSSLCLHHHERIDGNGYPYRIKGKNNSIYSQMCRVIDEFEDKRSKFYGDGTKPIKFVIKRLVNDDKGMVSKEVYDLLEECEPLFFNYFLKKNV